MQEHEGRGGRRKRPAPARHTPRARGWRIAATAVLLGGLLSGSVAARGSDTGSSGTAFEPLLGPLLPLRLPDRSSGFETGGFEEMGGANTQKGSLSVGERGTSGGRRSATARFGGGRGVGFARALWFVDWRPAETVCYGGSFHLPEGFIDRISGTVDLVRWDNYATDPVHTDHGGLTLWSDAGLRLLKEQLGRDDYRVLVGPVRMAEDRWVRLVVQQTLSPDRGVATSVVYVDGKRVGASAAPNSYGRPATAVRMGIVAVDARSQDDALELRFDDVFYRDGPCTTDDV